MNPKFPNQESLSEEDLFIIYKNVFPELLNQFLENKEYFSFRDFLLRTKEAPILPENPHTSKRPPSKAMVAAEKVSKAKLYVEAHYRRTIRLKEVANIAGCSKSTFSLLFKQHTGQTFISYLNAYRVEKSIPMLQETNEPVIEIGYDIGFNTPHSYNDAFKKNKGITPGEYRKLMS